MAGAQYMQFSDPLHTLATTPSPHTSVTAFSSRAGSYWMLCACVCAPGTQAFCVRSHASLEGLNAQRPGWGRGCWASALTCASKMLLVNPVAQHIPRLWLQQGSSQRASPLLLQGCWAETQAPGLQVGLGT